MGVTGLWQIVQPCARPIKIETLNRKRLAVDASIWIYQFLKAVRDKEGNALRNSHVVGFFRRICKLLFFGIKPVFVFDGGAPALKRQTIRARKSRREGRREDAVRTAGKLLAVQMQRRAEEQEAQRKAERERRDEEEETIPDEGLVYVDELQMSQQERQQNRRFRKKDQYHLPDLDVSLSEMGGANDPRVMSLEELQSYAKQFETGEDINVYDFSKIDYDSSFFMSLPPSDRYNILNAARLRSRLRMGHSKEQLDSMFPDRMAFSKFQIERVRERNELTQRLMHLNGFETMEFGGGRVAGEKGREYVLVKNDGVEGGWALGVISDEGKADKPIDIDKPKDVVSTLDEEGDEEEEFEDVPVEGLNRLPRSRTQNEQIADDLMKQRRAVYSSRKGLTRRKPKSKDVQESTSLFVQSSEDEVEQSPDSAKSHELAEEDAEQESENEELQRAIAMSLEGQGAKTTDDTVHKRSDETDDEVLDVFKQTAVEEQIPVPKGSGRAIANIVNKRAFKTAPESREITSFGVPTQKPDESDDEDSMDFQAALAESRRHKRKASPHHRAAPPPKRMESASDIAKHAGFQGPLPFEKLDLGTSLLGRKKMQERTEEAAGGFENPELAQKKQQKQSEPLPPWFAGNLDEDMKAQREIENADIRKAEEFNKQFHFQERGERTLRRADTSEIIDLDAEQPQKGFQPGEVVDLEEQESSQREPQNQSRMREQIKMGDMADVVRAQPEVAIPPDGGAITPPVAEALLNRDGSNEGTPAKHEDEEAQRSQEMDLDQDDEEEIEWSESDREDRQTSERTSDKDRPSASHTAEELLVDEQPSKAHRQVMDDTARRSPSLEFEDVELDATAQEQKPSLQGQLPEMEEDELQRGGSTSGLVAQESIPEDDEFDDFSDPEEAEMLRALTLEAEEHARFASSLNNKTQAQNIQEYERELKQLRNQQKKDRRDADEVTQIMIQECQALLRLFGLPYVTAPMEAEAQCAELVRLGLVDGIVTDDSDCFLFGGTRIYKNMFNQAKFVECYLTSDLEKEFSLTRDKLISVAHLLGSDYTEGLPGVGPVTALEIISEFGDLENFKSWWSAVQMNQIPKSEDATNAFRKKFRRNATKLFLPTAFPDQRVALAYQQPEVDSDPEAFQWGVPDLSALRSFLMATIGWSQERTDEVLVPVIKDMNRRADEGTQANITKFFDGGVGVGATGSTGEGFAPRKRVDGSKRMGSALKKMAEKARTSRGDTIPEDDEETVPTATIDAAQMASTAQKAKPAKAGRKRKSAAQTRIEDSDDEGSDFEEPKKKRTKSKGKRNRTSKKAAADGDNNDSDDI